MVFQEFNLDLGHGGHGRACIFRTAEFANRWLAHAFSAFATSVAKLLQERDEISCARSGVWRANFVGLM